MLQNRSSETGSSSIDRAQSGSPHRRHIGLLAQGVSFLDRYPLVLATAFFIGATLLVTYPGVRKLTTHFWGMGDLWQHVWNFWWFDKALTEFYTSPYFTEYQYYPNTDATSLTNRLSEVSR